MGVTEKGLQDLAHEQKLIGESVRERQRLAPGMAGARLSWPLRGRRRITSRFGLRKHPLLGLRMPHHGIDIPEVAGAPVRSIGAGTVILVQELSAYGRIVAIDHGGLLASVYAHLSAIAVREGDSVRRGAVIGKVGRSGRIAGTHLHLELRRNGDAVNPLRIIEPPSLRRDRRHRAPHRRRSLIS